MDGWTAGWMARDMPVPIDRLVQLDLAARAPAFWQVSVGPAVRHSTAACAACRLQGTKMKPPRLALVAALSQRSWLAV